jgi:hypothetical protein
MTTLRGFVSVGDAENLWEAKWTGWTFQPRRSSLQLLENDEGTVGNEVIQESSLGFRRGHLKFTAQGEDQRDTVRGYDETGDEVSFTDKDGSTCVVLVDKVSTDWMFADLWEVECDLIQMTEPTPATGGSGSGGGS